MLKHFIEILPLKKILEFQNWKKGYETYAKKYHKPKIEPMIENFQDELYQLENKQARGVKLHANIRWKLESKKCPKTLFKLPERQNMLD